MSTLKRGTLVFFSLVLFALSLAAQTSRGTLTGTVSDSSGAVVPNATVELTDKATNIKRTTQSNEVGAYRFDAVNLGTYKLEVSSSGFSGFTTDNVIISANRTLNLDAVLKVGAAGESVTVEAAAESVQTTEQVHLATVSARKLADLPVQGQDSLNLMLIAPGVVETDLGGSLSSGIGSVNGSRPRGNNFLIDGVENNDISVAGSAITQTNNDAIQELSVQTSNFSAEFGRAGGAVINQVTKSGTNALHGTAAWIYKSQLFNASNQDERNAFDPTGTDPLKAKFLEHIPAFTVGGPIVIPKVYDGRNRTFFFAAGQWDRLNQGGTITTFTVPTAAGVTTLQALASAGCTRATTYLNSIDGLVAATSTANVSLAIPATTFAATGSCNGNARTGMTIPVGLAGRIVPSFAFNDNHQVRVDHKLTDTQQMSVRWLYTNTFQNNATVAVSRFFDADSTDRSMSLALTHTWMIKPTMTNEFRFNYGRINPQFPISNAGLGQTLPRITYATSGSLAGIGTTATFPQGRVANNWQYQDVVSLVRGRHQYRFGVDFLRQLARQVAPANIRGSLTYTGSTGGITGFSNFLDDFGGSTGSPDIRFGTPTYRPNLFRQAYFIQDSWRVTDDLTLNLGLRYENFGQPANIFVYPVVTLDAASFGVPSKVKHDNNNFGPTVGFAWSPRGDASKWFHGDGKMVVRGGFQLSYDAFFNNLLSNMAAANPNLQAPIPVVPNLTVNPRGTPNLSAALAAMVPAPLNPATDASSQFTEDIVNPYTMRYSFGVQREMPGGVILDVSYVGAQGRKLFTTMELNPFQPNATGTARGARLNPALGARQPRVSNTNSNFNSLQVEAKRGLKETFIGGLTFTGAYTWSKSMDTSSEAFTTNNQGSNLGSSRRIRLTNPGIDYGPSDFDVTHRFVSTLVWDIRGPKHGFLGQTLGGWTLSFVTPLQSGVGFDVYNGSDRDLDGSLAGDRPDVGNWNAPVTSRARIVPVGTCATGLQNPAIGTGVGQGCVTASDVRWVERGGGVLLVDPSGQTMRRNAIRTPGSVLVHMNVLKTFRITERFKLEYRAEIFNLANTQNLNYVPWPTAEVADPGPFLDYFQGRPAGSLSTESRNMRMGLKIVF